MWVTLLWIATPTSATTVDTLFRLKDTLFIPSKAEVKAELRRKWKDDRWYLKNRTHMEARIDSMYPFVLIDVWPDTLTQAIHAKIDTGRVRFWHIADGSYYEWVRLLSGKGVLRSTSLSNPRYMEKLARYAPPDSPPARFFGLRPFTSNKTVIPCFLGYVDAKGQSTIVSGDGKMYHDLPALIDGEFGSIDNYLMLYKYSVAPPKVNWFYSSSFPIGDVERGIPVYLLTREGKDVIYWDIRKREIRGFYFPVSPTEDVTAFRQYLERETCYPEEARIANKQGLVKLSFRIDKEYKVTDVKVLSSFDQKCAEAAVNVLKATPEWVLKRDKVRHTRRKKRINLYFLLGYLDGKACQYSPTKGDVAVRVFRIQDGKVIIHTH
jgi:hypothetical protein